MNNEKINSFSLSTIIVSEGISCFFSKFFYRVQKSQCGSLLSHCSIESRILAYTSSDVRRLAAYGLVLSGLMLAFNASSSSFPGNRRDANSETSLFKSILSHSEREEVTRLYSASLWQCVLHRKTAFSAHCFMFNKSS